MKRFFGLTVLAIAGAWCTQANATSYQINTYVNPRPSRISETRFFGISETRFFEKTGFLNQLSISETRFLNRRPFILGQVASPADGEVSEGQPRSSLEELLKN